MIWPWSEIAKWKRRATHYERLSEQHYFSYKTVETEYLKLSKAIRGAHRGIWRLKQKLKRYEQEDV